MRVFKYDINPGTPLVLPRGSTPLCAAEQHGVHRIWFEVPDTISELEVQYEVELIPTGFLPVPDGFTHLNSIFATNGNVWHVYYKRSFP